MSATDLFVSWKKPIYRGCPEQTIYTVQYNIVTARPNCGQTTERLSGSRVTSQKRVLLSNLYPDSAYNVTVSIGSRQLSGLGTTQKQGTNSVNITLFCNAFYCKMHVQ